MKYKAVLFFALICSSMLLIGQRSGKPEIDLYVSKGEKKVDVRIDGELFTAYIWPDMLKKPVLWPVISPGGEHAHT